MFVVDFWVIIYSKVMIYFSIKQTYQHLFYKNAKNCGKLKIALIIKINKKHLTDGIIINN